MNNSRQQFFCYRQTWKVWFWRICCSMWTSKKLMFSKMYSTNLLVRIYTTNIWDVLALQTCNEYLFKSDHRPFINCLIHSIIDLPTPCRLLLGTQMDIFWFLFFFFEFLAIEHMELGASGGYVFLKSLSSDSKLRNLKYLNINLTSYKDADKVK